MPRGYQGRKNWDTSGHNVKLQTDEVKTAREVVDPNYEDYLFMLQEKNRIITKLKVKDPRDIDLERKEQGFALYVNGANTRYAIQRDRQQPAAPVKQKNSKPPSKPKTAGTDLWSQAILDGGLAELESAHENRKCRAKTAPEKLRRKNWQAASVDIKTSRGEKVKVKAPDILTGNYEDDFEVDISDSFNGEYSDSISEEDSSSESESPVTESMARLLKHKGKKDGEMQMEARRYSKGRWERDDEDGDDEEEKEQLTLTLADVKKLRQSLEMNSSIRESLARHAADSDSESERGSPIPEEDEDDIVEEFVRDSLSGGSPPSHRNKSGGSGKTARASNNMFKPDDVIVLEFAPTSKEKADKQLSAQLRKDSESLGTLQGGREGTARAKRVVKNHSATEEMRKKNAKELHLKPENASRKQSRPLSANRKNRDEERVDSQDEAQAVMAALVAENERLANEQSSRDSHSAPGRSQHEEQSPLPDSQNADRPSSAALSWKERLKPTTQQDPSGGHQRAPVASVMGGGEVDLQNIVQKVLQLDTKGQKKLLRALMDLEHGADGAERGNPLKATAPMAKMVKSSSSGVVDVRLQILSNWGHDAHVGLTEIQFFDLSKQKIDIDLARVKVTGVRHSRGELAALFNGKYKTVKERNMWLCARPRGPPVELQIQLQHKESDPSGFGLSRIKVWNYNKSLNDLSVGAREVVIRVDNKVVYSGEMEKGCGNQVFDYSQTIPVCDLDGESASTSSTARSPPVRLDLPSPPPVDRSSAKPSTTPTMDNVALFRSMDTEGGVARSVTRTMNHEDSPDVICPHVDAHGAPERSARSPGRTHSASGQSADFPKESSGEPKARHKKSKLRKSKMAARLGGSSSSLDTSLSTSASASMSVDSETVASFTSAPGPRSGSPTKCISPSKARAPVLNGVPKQQEPESPDVSPVHLGHSPATAPSSQSRHLVVPRSLATGLGSGNKPASPYASDEEGCMLNEIRKLTKDRKTPGGGKGLPNWLNAEEIAERELVSPDTESLQAPPESRDQARKDLGLLENWPTAGLAHLPTFLDGGEASNAQGRKSKSKNLQVEDDDSEEEKKPLTPMKQIETSRAQWRKEQQLHLEESWTSLNLFDRSQKGRISLDLEKDVLDEYLLQEKGKPTQPAITEEEEEESPQEQLQQQQQQQQQHLVHSNDEDDDFTIPELPKGRELVITILTTWGDRHYVGLNGIEVFTSTGQPAVVEKIAADPSDINILEEYSKDPRVVTNLVDGINRTRDDTHMWLAPFCKGAKHQITVTFEKPINIAMMRIWNYNKSRIHSYRGTKDIQVTLDGEYVFKGEITRACGGIMGGSEAFGDTILFTMDEEILELVSQYDQAFEADLIADDLDEEEFQRPRTADQEERPFTSAAHGRGAAPVPALDVTDHGTNVQATMEGDTLVLKGKCLKLNFTATWGDAYYLGLTGLEVVGHDGKALPLTMSMVDAEPRDLHVLPGYETDDRTLDKLLDGTNITMSDEHMWLIPFTENEEHWLSIELDQPTDLTGLRLWNYNKSPEDTYRGAKMVHILLDGRQVSPPDGFLIRKGPGNCFFDFAQEISFTEPQTPRIAAQKTAKPSDSLILDEPSQEYEAIQKPCGFIYQFHLLSTWGDPYYVGLNGIEFYYNDGSKIELTENNISAYPDSVNVLEDVANDLRTPDKLIDGVNDTADGKHMWIAPILPSILNRVYVIFDEPQEISMIKIWNYSKTPNRGVKDFALLVDDLLVYNGTLDAVVSGARGILPNCQGTQRYHTILFTDNKHIRHREKHTVIQNQAGEQDVQLMNDRKVMATYSDPKKAQAGKPVNQAMRPKTSVPGKGGQRGKPQKR